MAEPREQKCFPTLGEPPFPDDGKDTAIAELRAAGFPRGAETLTSCEREVYKEGTKAREMARAGIHVPNMAGPDDTEWVWMHSVEVRLYGWKFRRAWYYWAARAESVDYHVPEDLARRFNEEYKLQVRVEGFAGGQDVRNPVGAYHIDTPSGLVALVGMLKKLYEESVQKRRATYT